MTQAERFYAVLRGETPDRAPFFPDITTWYQAARLGLGTEQPYWPGQYIPDGEPIHAQTGNLPRQLEKFSFIDFYKEFGWGLPAHVYDWYDESYKAGAEKIVETRGRERTVTFRLPHGELKRRYKLDAEGTWSEDGHMAGSLDKLDLVRSLVERTQRQPRPQRVERFLRETEGFGVCDLVIFRSPFGKLVHEYMGFENIVYALEDDEQAVLGFMAFQEHYDLELIDMAASMPGPVVIISDHADENLISPPWYKKYCMPYYKKACDRLHAAGKYVSTHLDGNFRGFLGFIRETGFDLLDGCTPAPMFNYEPEELAAALHGPAACGPGRKMSAWCGVPSGLFTFGYPREKIADFGERISRAFDGRVVVNVGDILPPMGDIEAVIGLGERMEGLASRSLG